MIAALFVDERGPYVGLPDVEVWGISRDARLYAGPHPVVAHPPCSRWCRLSGLVEARWGHKRGDDGGCFAAALAAVRRWGGVLEHPAHSAAWRAFDLFEPPASGGWAVADFYGGWTCRVDQGHYGHRARKSTWLYACSPWLPSLRWDRTTGAMVVSWCRNRFDDDRPRIGKREASATPEPFRDILIEIARRARPAVTCLGEAIER